MRRDTIILLEGEAEKAIEISTVNAASYPASAKAYASPGESYMSEGDRHMALENYRRSLALDRDNAQSAGMVRTLEESQQPLSCTTRPVSGFFQRNLETGRCVF